MIALKAMTSGKAVAFAGAVLALLVAFSVVLGGLHNVALAADSTASASAASAEASGSSASASSASAEPTGHQSIVYATKEAKDSSEQADNNINARSAGARSSWSIVNLICAIASLAFCIALLADAANKRVAGFVTRGRAVIGGMSAALALAGVFAMALTQNFAMPASIADELSIVFVAVLVVQVILFAIAKLGMSNASD